MSNESPTVFGMGADDIPPVGFNPSDRAALKSGVLAPASAFLGSSAHSFDFFNPSDPSHLLPGRTVEQVQTMPIPEGAGAFTMLNQVSGAFVENNGTTLDDQELGQFLVTAGARPPNLVVCQVRLTAQTLDKPVRILARIIAVFFS